MIETMKKYELDNLLALTRVECKPEEMNRIPTKGAVIFVTNRPIGLVEEVVMYKILSQVRNDFTFLYNDSLNEMDILSAKHFIDKDQNEIEPVLDAARCISLFPVGEMSTYKNKVRGFVDSKWDNNLIKKIHESNTTVVPFYLSLENNDMSTLLLLQKQKLMNYRTIFDLIESSNIRFNVRIGKPIKAGAVKLDNHSRFGRFLRAKLYSLSSKLKVEDFYIESKYIEELAQPVDADIIDRELAAIGDTNCIGEQLNFKVFICKAKKIPHTINEIGRLRELAFRQVGEGTNKSLDLDEFDLHYLHLFIYDAEKREIAGAYRIGDGSYIMKTFGRKGFYLNSLFKIKNEFSLLLEDCAELGRSFVAPNYQNQRLPLYLLWKGIAYYLNSHPQVKYFVGPVSISNSYSKLSKSFIVDFISRYHWDKFLAQFITPRSPFIPNFQGLDYEALIEGTNNSIKSLEEIIEDIDPNHSRIPVLIKKYFSQNASILSFNIDPNFNDALDGFMILDIRDIPKETLETFEKLKSIDF